MIWFKIQNLNLAYFFLKLAILTHLFVIKEFKVLKDQIFNIKYLEKKVYFGKKKYTRKLPQINVFIIIIIIIAYIIIINFKTPKSRKCKCIMFFQGAEKESELLPHLKTL